MVNCPWEEAGSCPRTKPSVQKDVSRISMFQEYLAEKRVYLRILILFAIISETFGDMLKTSGGLNMAAVIGVFPLYDEKKESIWMLPGYLEGIQFAGGIPVILPLKAKRDEVEQLVDMCDGFLFTGGHDIDPTLYHQSQSEKCGIVNKERDRSEQQFFELAYTLDKPMLGICRGISLKQISRRQPRNKGHSK